MSASAADIPGAPSMEEQIAKLRSERVKLDEEAAKLRSESTKLEAEALKLGWEALKLERDRALAPWTVVAATAGAVAAIFGAAVATVKLLG